LVVAPVDRSSVTEIVGLTAATSGPTIEWRFNLSSN
jgi:hypothetical protein